MSDLWNVETALHAVIAALNSVAAAIVIWQAMCALNRMKKQTRASIKWAYRMIALGGFIFCLHPPDPDIGGIGQVALVFGLAAAFIFGRNIYCFSCPARRD